MKSKIVLASFCVLSGCAAFERTHLNLERALETAVAAERFEVHYLRQGNTSHYLQRACTGSFCTEFLSIKPIQPE